MQVIRPSCLFLDIYTVYKFVFFLFLLTPTVPCLYHYFIFPVCSMEGIKLERGDRQVPAEGGAVHGGALRARRPGGHPAAAGHSSEQARGRAPATDVV